MSTYPSHQDSISTGHSPRPSDVAAPPTAPEVAPAVRRYAPKQPGHSRPVLWLGAGQRQGTLGLSWIGLRPSRRFGA